MQRFYLEDSSVVEQGKQLQQVVQDIGLLLLHAQDVGRVEGFGTIHLQLLVEGKESELEKVLDDDGNLRREAPTEPGECTCRQVSVTVMWRRLPQCRQWLSSRRSYWGAGQTAWPTGRPEQEEPASGSWQTPCG